MALKTANEILLEKREPLDEAPKLGVVQFAQRFVTGGKKLLAGKVDPKFKPLVAALKKAMSDVDDAIDKVL